MSESVDISNIEEYRESTVVPGVLVGINGTLKYVDNGKVINQYHHPKGYKQCSIYGRTYLAHTLVAHAYPEICGVWFDGAEVDHLDTVRDNNVAFNLKVVTRSQNHLNPITRQRMSEAQIGHTPRNNKPVECTGKVMDIFICRFESAYEASRILRGYSTAISTSIKKCCKGKGHRCLGRRWRYVEE